MPARAGRERETIFWRVRKSFFEAGLLMSFQACHAYSRCVDALACSRL